MAQNLTTEQALNLLVGGYGYDEVDFAEHLQEGDELGDTYWTPTNDLHCSDCDVELTIKDLADSNLTNFFTGELLDSLHIIQPVANRTITGSNTWANGNMTNWHQTSGRLWTNAASADLYFTLAPTYAPMTAGTVYNLTFVLRGSSGTWEVQDYGGRALPLTSSSTDGTGLDYMRPDSSKTWSYQFTAPAGTAGGFRIKSYGGAGNQFWDDFALTVEGSEAVAVGMVFKVGGAGDTTDNALAAAKDSAGISATAVAANDLFAVTNITTAAVVYIGNAVGSYAFASNRTSTLVQTSANRASAGLNVKGRNSKEYAIAYTIAVREPIAPAGAVVLTLETFADTSTTMPITAGAQVAYFKSASDADAADFKIQSVSTAATAGVLAISGVSLLRCCDHEKGDNGQLWWKIEAVGGDATEVAAVSVTGDDVTSQTVSEGDDTAVKGLFSRVTGATGIVRAHRSPYRS